VLLSEFRPDLATETALGGSADLNSFIRPRAIDAVWFPQVMQMSSGKCSHAIASHSANRDRRKHEIRAILSNETRESRGEIA